MDQITVTSLVTLATITTLATLAMVVMVFAEIYRENRQRRWDREDRRETAVNLADKVKDAALTLAAKVETVKTQTAKSTAKLETMLEHNTNLTQTAVEKAESAFHEANNVNAKLEKLGITRNEQDAKQEEATDRLTKAINEQGKEVQTIREDKVIRDEDSVIKDNKNREMILEGQHATENLVGKVGAMAEKLSKKVSDQVQEVRLERNEEGAVLKEMIIENTEISTDARKDTAELKELIKENTRALKDQGEKK